jgi:hypothetical protein
MMRLMRSEVRRFYIVKGVIEKGYCRKVNLLFIIVCLMIG